MNGDLNAKRAGAVGKALLLGGPALLVGRAACTVAPFNASGAAKVMPGQVPPYRLGGKALHLPAERNAGRSEHLTLHGTKQALALGVGGCFSPNLLSPRRQEWDNKGEALGLDSLTCTASLAARQSFMGGCLSEANKTSPKGFVNRDYKGEALGLDLDLDLDLASRIVTRRAKTNGFMFGLVCEANRACPEGDAQAN